MDFGTMKAKAHRGEYATWEDLRADLRCADGGAMLMAAVLTVLAVCGVSCVVVVVLLMESSPLPVPVPAPPSHQTCTCPAPPPLSRPPVPPPPPHTRTLPPQAHV